MTRLVTRTCTEILARGERTGAEPESRPLSAFRSTPAYALLGDPGLGKTTAFERECRELGEKAHLIDARDFVTLDLDSHPEWRGKTLFIDGLDERRACVGLARAPLDRIRTRLDSLGSPRFRISCRDADWLGENDRARLNVVAPNGEVATLRLDPLTGSDIEEVLTGHPLIEDPQLFMREAQSRGVDSLLANPQTLNMLADVVGGQGDWPRSRLETFEMACLQMATEHNEERSLATRSSSHERLLDAAGYLCAAQLLTGAAGHSLAPGDVDSQDIARDDCDYVDQAALSHAIGTKLFRAVGLGRFTAVHRHVAEFLGARHLARLITGGLPATRVLALISGADGVVVTGMRGISGWLAAQSGDARGLLIERDPIGVALYGDLRAFSPDEKSRLLRALGRREVLSPLWRETPWREIGSAFGALASPDMEATIDDILSDPSRDSDHQGLIHFVLTLLWQGSPLPGLARSLLGIVWDGSWPPGVRSFALDAFLHTAAKRPSWKSELKEALAGILAGTIPDPDSEMRGALLARLYPEEIPPVSVWDHLTERGNANLFGHDWHFWNQHLLSRSSDEDAAELLDQLSQRRSVVVPALRSQNAKSLPLRLLARGLEAHGADLTTPRLYSWLAAAAPPLWERPSSEEDSLNRVRDWLEKRPAVQRAVLLEGLRGCPHSDDYLLESQAAWGALHGSVLLADFDLWCLEQAIELSSIHARASEDLFDRAFRAHREDDALSLDDLADRIRGYGALERRLSVLLERWVNSEVTAAVDEVQTRDPEEEAAREREAGIAHVRANAEALRESRGSVALLGELGRAFFFYRMAWLRQISPAERLSELLGGDESLVEAVLAGFRGTVWRSDIPGVEEILRLKESSRRHRLALPFLAGLEILQRETPERLEELSENQMRAGLAFYYCTPAAFAETPRWHGSWLDRSPEAVADVVARCSLSAIRHGNGYSPALETIKRLDPGLRHETTLSLLTRFPPRAGLEQLATLDRLLWNALACPDRTALLDLIETKLSLKSMGVAQRVRWLAAGVVAGPEAYGARVEEFAAEREARVRGLASFFNSPESSLPLPFPRQEGCALALRALIALIGRSFAPADGDGFVTLEMTASKRISRLIQQLASLPGEDAVQALDSLTSEHDLVHWRDQLERARDNQRAVHRDATYGYPGLAQLHRALRNEEPANAGDLAALVLDRVSAIASVLRTTNTDDWRQYWNEDSLGHPLGPKHEDACRDALLSRLRLELPEGVDAQPEGQYAGDKRSDIRVAYQGCNVPVEIKKNRHANLWSAIRHQLIALYTTDVETSGYGIYVVFWFDTDGTPAPPSGTRPTTPDELQRRLRGTLTAEEALKIAVLVVDVRPAS